MKKLNSKEENIIGSVNIDNTESRLLYNQSIVKIIGIGDDRWIKTVNMNAIRKKGTIKDANVVKTKKGSKNDRKLGCNIRSAKARIRELIMCNNWELMITVTINGTKYNREDLDKWKKDFLQWLQNYRKKYGIDLKYLLIPELHKDNICWHMHGLIIGLPLNHLRKVVEGDDEYTRLEKRVRMGFEVYVWKAYERKFGYCDVEKIRNKEAVCNYLIKAINDNVYMNKGVNKLNAKMYYASKGLNRAIVVKRGTQIDSINQVPTYGNKYCRIYWEKYSDNTLAQRLESIDDGTGQPANINSTNINH